MNEALYELSLYVGFVMNIIIVIILAYFIIRELKQKLGDK